MGSKNKLKRFKENETFKNVIQPTRDEVVTNFSLKGKWHSFFGNKNPIVIELGCGKGEYTIALARKNSHKNFIGIDIKGARFWRGAKTALEEKIENVAFVRTQIELVDFIFAKNEVDEIWITFPDPFYKKVRRRLTHPNFLNHYRKILKDDGIVHLKTDDDMLFEFTMETLEQEKIDIIYADDNIYSKPLYHSDLEVKTAYENMHLRNRKTIKYVKFRL